MQAIDCFLRHSRKGACQGPSRCCAARRDPHGAYRNRHAALGHALVCLQSTSNHVSCAQQCVLLISHKDPVPALTQRQRTAGYGRVVNLEGPLRGTTRQSRQMAAYLQVAR